MEAEQAGASGHQRGKSGKSLEVATVRSFKGHAPQAAIPDLGSA